MTVLAYICGATGIYAALSALVVLFADNTVTTYRPAWADRLTLRPHRLTTAALHLIRLGGTHAR